MHSGYGIDGHIIVINSVECLFFFIASKNGATFAGIISYNKIRSISVLMDILMD